VPTCLVVQHLEPEGPYSLATSLAAAGVTPLICRVFDGEPLPADLDACAAVVVMGGPMSAYDDTGFPTRRAEIALLREALARELPVLGICLGAQLLVEAAGGRVFAGSGAEIGWGTVSLTADAGDDPLLHGVPDSVEVLHWHGDTYELPPGAVHLARSGRYENQAFRLGAAAWGLQFHLEVDEIAVGTFAAEFADEARAAGVEPGDIVAAAPAALVGLATTRDVVLGRFAEHAARLVAFS
jgi:GMP synthase-like glutamine amidotransferase